MKNNLRPTISPLVLEQPRSQIVKRTWIEIDAAAFDHNVQQYKRAIGSAQLAAVIKANAYGHGIEVISQLAEQHPLIDQLHVATASEALLLEKIGVTKPIFIMSYIDCDPVDLLNKNIEISVSDNETIEQLNAIGNQHSSCFQVHLKLDTGLSRFGVLADEAVHYCKKIMQMPGLHLKGMYSHCSESPHHDQTFTQHQRDLFKQAVEECQANNIKIPLIHLANSAAATSLDLSFCNLFRVGVGLYGLWPSPTNKTITQKRFPGFDLKPILTWKSYIATIRCIKKGSYIGYARTYQAPHDMQIATVPIGYYDGYDFRLFNKAAMLVHQQRAPIIGRIAMNVTCIDVTHIKNVSKGDEVAIMGPQSSIHPYTLGKLAGNPNVREMTTKINHVITRRLM